jgi:DNA-binding response OmpR family regulator
VTQENLERQGYAITHCHDGKEALQAIREEDFDLCILDVMLPEVDGFTIAEEVRKHDADVPILFLTAKSLKEDRLHGLRLGADDYITKPFSIEELILKIEVFLRRSKVVQPLKTSQIRLGKFSFDYENLTLHHGEQHKRLTQREADLLWFLAQSRNQVVKRSEILKAIWGDDDYFLGRSLDVFISRLRKYLSSDDNVRIENIHGVGFCFQIKESA